MKSKQLLILVGLFVVLAGGAYVIRSGGGSGNVHQAQQGSVLVDEAVFDQVAEVVVTRKEYVQHLALEGNQWVVRSMGNYPADVSLVIKHLLSVSRLEVGQVVRGGAATLDEFGLGADKATTISMKDAQGGELAVLALGDSRTGGGGRYMRVGDGEVVLVNDGLTSFPLRNPIWSGAQLIHVNGTDLARVESSVSNTVSKIEVGPNNTFTLEGLPEGKQVDVANAGKLVRALQYLNFDNVAPKEASDESLGLENPVSWKGVAQDGIVYTMSVGSDMDGGAWVKLAVEAASDPAPERGDLDDAAWELAQTNHKATQEAALAKVETLKKATAGWRFHVPPHSAANFRVARAALIADPPKPEAPPTSGRSNGPDLNGAAQQAVQAIASVVPPVEKEKNPAAKVVTEPVEVPAAK